MTVPTALYHEAIDKAYEDAIGKAFAVFCTSLAIDREYPERHDKFRDQFATHVDAIAKAYELALRPLLPIVLLLLIAPGIAQAKVKCWNSPDPPYELHERWCETANQKTRWVTGRTEVPIAWKLNPIWWFGNDYEPTPPAWYLPNDPTRQVKWYLRNPLQNAGNYVFGVKDLNYTVRFVKGPPVVTNYADINQIGCIYTVLDNSRGGNLWFPRTYVSCTGKYVTWYAGTQWSGFYGFKVNVRNAAFQVF